MIVSAAAKTQLQDHERRELRQRKGQKKATGVYKVVVHLQIYPNFDTFTPFKLKPDYAHFMKPAEKGGTKAEEYPSSDFDLVPYRRKWVASEQSMTKILVLEKSCDN